MWNFKTRVRLAKQRRGGYWRTPLGSIRTIVAGLPAAHWLTLSMAAPTWEPKQIPPPHPLRCSLVELSSVWLFATTTTIVTTSPGAKMVASKENKTLSKRKITQLEVRGCWQKLHLVCSWFLHYYKLLPRNTGLRGCYLIFYVSRTWLSGFDMNNGSK